MDLKDTKTILRKYRISPNKIQGQNFLVDEGVARREVEAAHIKSSDVVLEVGPGLGALTEHLLKKGCRVIAIEKDPSFVKVLKDRFISKDLEIINADVLKMDLPEFDVVVSNIPYVISSPLTFKLLKHGFSRGVLTYQEEFAARLVAKPGGPDYSRLSVAAYYYTETEILETIPPHAFYPQPKVRSAVVRLTPRPPTFEVDEDRFFRLVRGMFTVKRKTVKNAILIAKKVAGVEIDKNKVPGELLEKRVFELSPKEIALISKVDH
ncbi:MAG: 16S rRNA (adenine(1518)-N(6)/adenine(1519)-N(6))-dimethyltransferase RsmA [Candidatus Hydrothermarchaeales archaeon]